MTEPNKLSDETILMLTKARAQMMKSEPFFGYLSLYLEPTKANIGTFGTDGKRLLIDEGFAKLLSIDDWKFILAHEVVHVALDHMLRRGARVHWLWNVAIDLATNGMLIKDGFKMPQKKGIKGLHDRQFDGKCAEEIYDLLPKPQSQGGKGKGQGKGQGNDPNQDQDGQGDGSEGDEEKKGFGDKHIFDDGKSKDKDGNDIPLNEEAIREFQKEVMTAAKMARDQGNCPGWAETMIDEIVAPKIRWQKVLQRFLQENIAMNDFTYTRLKRQYMAQGIAIPTLRSKDLPPVGIAIDTSGSVGDTEMQQFISEIQSFSRLAWNFPVHLIMCDCQVTNYAKVMSRDIDYKKHLPPKGRGGTDFRPVFDKIRDEKIKISCLIYLTDTQGDFPEQRPNYPVLWVSCYERGQVPWGQLTFLDCNNNRLEAK